MATTPEGVRPFSPSVFLDMPPTPTPQLPLPAGDDSDDDDILPYISRMLMEEDIDDKFFYQFPDHPALLTAQQPYAEILSDATTSRDSDNATTSGAASSSSPDAPAAAIPTWPYDPIELSQLLRSPPYPDIGITGLSDDDGLLWPGDVATAAAGFQPDLTLFNGNDTSSSFAAAAPSGAATAKDDEGSKITSLPAGDGDQAELLASAFFDGQSAGDMDMLKLNQAFLKGMEEANKFLPVNSNLAVDVEATSQKFFPTDSKTVISAFAAGRAGTAKEVAVVDGCGSAGNGRGRKNREDDDLDLEGETGRRSKLMMTAQEEETGAGEMMDDIMLRGFETFMKGMQELRIAMDNDAGGKKNKGRKRRVSASAAEVVDLRTMLIHCAQAVATDDRRSAAELLRQVKQHSPARGDATQRLAHCFAEGLEARLAGTGSDLYRSLVAQRTSVVEFLRAYKLFMVACPFKKAKFVFANNTIMNAAAGRRRLHVVDYGVGYGFQWPSLLQLLAERDGGPPEVRITGIDRPQPGFRPAAQIEETGRRLTQCAREHGVPFTFRAVAARWEAVRAEDLDLDAGEVLVVNSQRGLGSLIDGDGDGGASPRDAVLRNVRAMRPDVFVQWAAHGGYGAPFFLTRFREALFYYSAMFDALEATIPRDNDDRLLIERDILGRSALNVIACEGGDRVDRPETYRQWTVRNHRAGLRQLPLQPDVVKLVREKVRKHYHRDFGVDEDGRWLLQGWKGRVLNAMSTWVADDNAIFF